MCSLNSIRRMRVTAKGVGHILSARRKQQSHVQTQRIMLKDEEGKQKKCVPALKINTPPRTSAHTASVRKKEILELATIKT